MLSLNGELANQILGSIDAVGAALLGGLIALLGVYLTNRHNATVVRAQQLNDRARETSNLLRERGEELYVHTHKWLGNLTAFYFRRNAVMRGQISMADLTDMELEDLKDAHDITRLEMLIDVYFKQIRPAYDEVVAARDYVNKIWAAFELRHRTGDIDSDPYIQSFLKAHSSVAHKGDDLKTKIVEAIRSV